MGEATRLPEAGKPADHDDDAEMIVVGSMMTSSSAIEAATDALTSRDFYRDRNATIFARVIAAWAAGDPTEPIALARQLADVGELQRVGGAPYLHDCVRMVPTAANVGYYARIVAERATTRRHVEYATRLLDAAKTGSAAWDELLARTVEVDQRDVRQRPRGIELDDFLGEELDGHDWLVPRVIERGDRCILTGPEGGGKSTALRQIGVQVASGIHPFGGEPFKPLRVLLVDVENSRRQVHRKLRPLRLAAGGAYGGGMVVEIRTEGLDLTDSSDVRWLTSLVDSHQPDLLITGPIYKLASGDPCEEGPARYVARAFDAIRSRYGCALLLEAHSPHASNGAKRPTRPYGASLWLRWPEFGIHLGEDGTLTHWRGPRDERDWPAMLQRGGEWPWTPVTRPRDLLWARILGHCTEAGCQVSIRDLVELTSSSVGAVHRAIGEHRSEWDTLKTG